MLAFFFQNPGIFHLGSDCMLSPFDEVMVIVQGEVVGPASVGNFSHSLFIQSPIF